MVGLKMCWAGGITQAVKWGTSALPLIWESIVANPMKYKDGYFYPPDSAGFGLELNEKAVSKFIAKGKSSITIGS